MSTSSHSMVGSEGSSQRYWGAISDDFTQFIKMCAKSAAEKNWDVMGARSVNFAEQSYLQMFRKIVGLTTAREGAIWMRKTLAYYIDLKRGSPRGEDGYTWSRLWEAQRRHTREYLDYFFHGRNQRGFGRA